MGGVGVSRSDDDADVDFGDLPVLDDLAGPTREDNERHAIARAAFLRHMLTDDRVVHLFADWRARIGVDSTEDALKRAGEVYERLTGLDWRDQDAAHPAELKATPEEALIFERAEREVSALFVAAGDVPFAADAIALAKAAGLTWAWLPAELVESFWLDVAGRASGRRFEERFWSEPPETPVRGAQRLITAVEGESWEAVADRLANDVAAFLIDAGMRSQVPAGRSIQGHEVATIERDVAWFYRTRVKEPKDSVASVARASGIKADDPRKSVYDAIDRARRLLGFGRFEVQ